MPIRLIDLVKLAASPPTITDEVLPSHDDRFTTQRKSKVIQKLILTLALFAAAVPGGAAEYQLFARTNLVPWCIVPYDAKRGPEERGRMLEKLGLKKLAYDWRGQDVPKFDEEVAAMKRHGVELTAWWFPFRLDANTQPIMDCIRRNNIHPQLWVPLEGGTAHWRLNQALETTPEAQAKQIERFVTQLKPLASEAMKLGCKVALYNYGGWTGVPENQIEIIKRLKQDGFGNVGMVYTLHHSYGDLDRFAELFLKMKPNLLAISLHGMFKDGDLSGNSRREAPVGQGDLDLGLLRIIKDSGWTGPVGILGEIGNVDIETRLQDQLDGLDWLVPQLDGKSPGPRPVPRAWTPPEAPRPASTNDTSASRTTGNVDYWGVEDATARAALPEFRTIPAALPDELTPANGFPKRETFRTWHRSHGDNSGARYSALAQINRGNVTNLQVAWTYHSKDGAANIQCIPVVAEGMMFAPTAGEHIVAVNAATGSELWRFKPQGRPAHRGLIYCSGVAAETPRLFFVAGSQLYALDAKTGQPIGGFGKDGRTPLPGSATAGPVIFQNIIVVPGFERDVWGVDAVTGELIWTFHTVPKPGEFGYDTWDQAESGANCWGGMALDEVRGIAYVTTGSPKDNFTGGGHRGDNLFANCLIAIDVRTGKRLWHFQEIHHDIWDLDLPAPPNLTTITRNGRRVDVVAAVTKIGNTLLLDRVTGKPIFPYRERRAPTSNLPGEQTSPYQPDVELPEPFSQMEFKPSDLTDRSEEAAEFVAGRFKSAKAGFFQPSNEGKLNLFFGIHGGAEWTGACVDPESGRLFVSANHVPWIISVFRDEDPPYDPKAPRTRGQEVFEATCAQCHGTNLVGIGTAPPLRGLRYRLKDEAVTNLVRTGKNGMPAQPEMAESDLKALMDFLMFRDRPPPSVSPKAERPRYSYNGYPRFSDHEGYPGSKPPRGTLNCIDLNSGKLLWKVPLGEYPELTEAGMPKTGTENFGGPMVTAGGLIFCSGTRDSKIRAFDKNTGAELWSAKLPWVGSAPPASYEVNGRQYIVIATTGGGKLGTPAGDAYVAFALASPNP